MDSHWFQWNINIYFAIGFCPFYKLKINCYRFLPLERTAGGDLK
jgi:hypothetical protein